MSKGRASIAPFAFAAFVALAACSRRSSPGSTEAPAPSLTVASSTSGAPPSAAGANSAIDALAASDGCTFGHRGVLLDLGDATTRARLAPTNREGRIEPVEREGATWAKVLAKGASITFVATPDDVAAATADGAVPVIEARVRGGSARSIAVFLNGKAAGTFPLIKGESKVVALALPLDATTPNAPQIVAGTNEVLLRFRGAARGGASAQDEQAEIDWIHVGGDRPARPGEPLTPDAYPAPTRAETIGSVTLPVGAGDHAAPGVPLRAVALRAPGYERCVGWLPGAGRLVGAVGASGPGDADVELRVLRDRAPPAVLASMHLAGNAAWKAFDLPLDKALAGAPSAAKGTLGAIELVVTRSTKGVRVAFGEPRVITPAAPLDPAPASVPRARSAVVVVLGDVAPRVITPYGGATAMPELDALAKSGVTFESNRASSGAESGAFASILTGLGARGHGVVDDSAGLAADVTTLADVARQAGIRAALFTSNPATSGAFGFGRSWDTFVEHLPTLEEQPGAGLAPFDDAARWIAEHAGDKSDRPRFLVVVHARGGHPPWDATPEELKAMPPSDYTGSIDPRRAAELLMRARGVGPSRGSAMHLTDADRARAWALYGLALRSHDAALGRLLDAIEAAGRDDDTLVVVTGDVGLGEARAPLEDGDVIGEPSLATPLVVRFPRGDASAAPFAGRRVASPTTSFDVARTVVASFGLAPPAAFVEQAADLADVAAGAVDPRGRPEVAVYGNRSSLAWGGFVLRATSSDASPGAPPDVTKLCERSLEPACTSDVRGAFPLALVALRRELNAMSVAPHAPLPVVEPGGLRAALKLWGL